MTRPDGRAARPALSLKGRALKFLAMREHSRVELQRKLAPYAESSEQVDGVLSELEQKGWLSAQRFAESLLHRKSARYGAMRLQAELSQHELPADVARDAAETLRATEFDRAWALWSRRYGLMPVTPEEKLKQMRYLAGRGFAADTVRQVLKKAALLSDGSE